jgi:hypothetical protein
MILNCWLFGASDEDMKKEAVREKYRIENYQLNKKKKKLGASGLGLYFFLLPHLLYLTQVMSWPDQLTSIWVILSISQNDIILDKKKVQMLSFWI